MACRSVTGGSIWKDVRLKENAPSELHKAPSAEREAQLGHISPNERARPGWLPERWSSGPPRQL